MAGGARSAESVEPHRARESRGAAVPRRWWVYAITRQKTMQLLGRKLSRPRRFDVRSSEEGEFNSISSGFHEGLGEEVGPVVDGGAHETQALGGGTVEVTVLDLLDEAMAAELGELAADAGAAFALLGPGAGRSGVQQALEFAVAEAADGVVAVQHGPEEVAVVG